MSYKFKPQWKSQGAGARVIRVIGNQRLRRLDPFLMLDYFKVRLPAGFPDHPHRGFQTITYMKSGSFYHEDFKGHKGKINPGDIQWMTAGKGIVHAQMPASFQQDSIGFQLWLNLKAQQKMKDPMYQQFTADKVPIGQKNGANVKVICGQWQGIKGPVIYKTPSLYMDIELKANGTFNLQIPGHWNCIIFVHQGQANYEANNVKHQVDNLQCLVLQKGNSNVINHKIQSKTGAKFVLIGGQPLKQPIASYGPFVMNTDQQIQQTFIDYQTNRNGFQNANIWQSKIQNLRNGKKYNDL